MKIMLQAWNFYPCYGGVENSIFYIGAALQELGHKAIVFTRLTSPDLNSRDEFSGMEIIRYSYGRYNSYMPGPIAAFKPFARVIEAKKALSRFLESEHIDAIWSRRFELCCATWMSDFSGDIVYMPPVVVPPYYRNISRNQGSIKQYSWAYRFAIPQCQLVEACAIHGSRKVVTFSNSTKQQILRHYRLSSHKISVIQPGVDVERFRPRPKDSELLQEIDLAPESKVVLYVGRTDKDKNISILLEAFARIHDPWCYLVIVGDGACMPELKLLCVKLGIKDRVIFTGFRRDTERFYSIATAFALPTIYEGFGQVYLEAMASGIPCVGFRSDYPKVMVATEEIIQHGRTGFIADAISASFLADAILSILELSDEEHNAMSHYTRGYCTKNFSWTRFTERVLNEN